MPGATNRAMNFPLASVVVDVPGETSMFPITISSTLAKLRKPLPVTVTDVPGGPETGLSSTVAAGTSCRAEVVTDLPSSSRNSTRRKLEEGRGALRGTRICWEKAPKASVWAVARAPPPSNSYRMTMLKLDPLSFRAGKPLPFTVTRVPGPPQTGSTEISRGGTVNSTDPLRPWLSHNCR